MGSFCCTYFTTGVFVDNIPAFVHALVLTLAAGTTIALSLSDDHAQGRLPQIKLTLLSLQLFFIGKVIFGILIGLLWASSALPLLGVTLILDRNSHVVYPWVLSCLLLQAGVVLWSCGCGALIASFCLRTRAALAGVSLMALSPATVSFQLHEYDGWCGTFALALDDRALFAIGRVWAIPRWDADLYPTAALTEALVEGYFPPERAALIFLLSLTFAVIAWAVGSFLLRQRSLM